MRLVHLEVKNWRNFKSVSFDMSDRLFVVGANAVGKSNLLDIFRFLHDIAAVGGGLQFALEKRGGLPKVRSLFSRNNAGGAVVIDVRLVDGEDKWQYLLSLRSQKGGKRRAIVDREIVRLNDVSILERPLATDQNDPDLTTQTHLEQIMANSSFRPLVDYFSSIEYLHPVPQLMRDPVRAGSVNNDPFGGDLIVQMSSLPLRAREARMRRTQNALQAVVPEFKSLQIVKDAAGIPHLVAGYENWRTTLANQSESDFSDGTLRLIGLLWSIARPLGRGGPGILLLEEPEISLNSSIVKKLPQAFAVARRSSDMQLVISTHSPDILDDEGISDSEVLMLWNTRDGSVCELLKDNVEACQIVSAGIPRSEAIARVISPDVRGLLSALAGR